MLIQGKLPETYNEYASSVSDHFTNIHKESDTSVHYWINSITDLRIRNALEILKSANEIKQQIEKSYHGYNIISVPTSDEVYISVDPLKRKNSDVVLSDCHYDAPFKYVPQCGNKFIRIILALNDNNTTFTIVDDKSSVLSTLDFNGIDYNNDFHCVKGYIPKNKIRVLLKLHFICIHPDSSDWCVAFTRNINNSWTHISRELMRTSAKPQTITDHILSYIIQITRYIYINTNIIVWIVIVICIISSFIIYDRYNKKIRNISKISKGRRFTSH